MHTHSGASVAKGGGTRGQHKPLLSVFRLLGVQVQLMLAYSSVIVTQMIKVHPTPDLGTKCCFTWYQIMCKVITNMCWSKDIWKVTLNKLEYVSVPNKSKYAPGIFVSYWGVVLHLLICPRLLKHVFSYNGRCFFFSSEIMSWLTLELENSTGVSSVQWSLLLYGVGKVTWHPYTPTSSPMWSVPRPPLVL